MRNAHRCQLSHMFCSVYRRKEGNSHQAKGECRSEEREKFSLYRKEMINQQTDRQKKDKKAEE